MCEACGYRRPYENRCWCRACILAWQREDPERTKAVTNCLADLCCLSEVIPERYAMAHMEHLPAAIREAAEGLADERGLFLWGPPGVGKTYSLCAIAHRLYFSGWDVARTAYEMLVLQIRDSYKPGATRTELDILRPLIAVDKLILEDVGTTVGVGKVESDFSLRTFLVLLDTRLEHCRATYISSNKSIEEIGKSFDQRIASRLREACEVIRLEGRDKRSVADGGQARHTRAAVG